MSARHAVAVLVLAGIAAVPVAVHGRGLLDRDSCSHPGALRPARQIAGTRQDLDGALESSRGTVDSRLPGAPPLRYALVRSYQPSRLITRPSRLALTDLDAQSQQLVRTRHGGERLPIYWLEERGEQFVRFVAYFFVYEGEPVAWPTLALLRSAVRRLYGGARPLTVFVIGGPIAPGHAEQVRSRAEEWLFEAWNHYRSACGIPAPTE